MNKYGEAALKAVELFESGINMDPRDAWELIANDIFADSPSCRRKGCPKSAFLGLCEEGLVRGIPKGSYTRSQKNKGYALKAIELLKENPNLSSNPNKLWKMIISEPKAHNSQMDVVVALWANGLIEI
ncbi:hypothetical protein V7O66_12345 [Methanolobus sp. ZRKC3]|uniref:DUF6979 family protein n=1 Tax=Methanolobus sp. ZRKC3 TaxID=3125786 RepID=UPI003244BAFF